MSLANEDQLLGELYAARAELRRLTEADRWISVDEALPAIEIYCYSKDVLATDGLEICMACLFDLQEGEPLTWKITASSGMSFANVTHWRFLPALPRM